MGRWQIGFEYPWLLGLLALIPLIWWLGRRSLAGLGPWRQWIAIILRTLVLLLIIAALAGIHWIWISDRLTVIYLLDQSDSIPAPKRQLMLRYAIENTNLHRRTELARQDRAGLILFGREASIEFPPLDEDLPPIKQPESNLGLTDATNLEAALKLAQACFPENSARRVVILTDGNETLGNASATAKSLTDAGIGIDIVPIQLDSQAEILIEKIDIPGQVRQGQPIEARVVLQRYAETEQAQPVDGRLRVTRRVGNQSEVIADGSVTLDQEINVVPIPHRIEEAAGYTYEAEFIPDDATLDSIPQNNRATAFTYARGKGRVMLVENSDRVGEYKPLVDALRREGIEVETRDTSQLFSSIVELQGYDSVILAGVSRTVGENAGQMNLISDSQIEALTRSVQQFGTGVLMVGGPEAFGAGGWANTKLEEAMPVDFQIKNAKIQAVGALAMVMHASEMAEGNFWQKKIARSAMETLGPMDYCGIVQYDMSGINTWMWGGKNGLLQIGPNRNMMRTRISRMVPGDMPDFDSSMRLALASLNANPASIKHMIVISDGDPTPPSNTVLNGFVAAGIKVSTVAVGTHGPANSALLKKIAQATAGKYHEANNPKVLPEIFMREARRVSRSLISEPEGGVQPQLKFRHDALSGISDKLPPIKGFVLTHVKDNPLVEVPILSPLPSEAINASVLATWTYGAGRTAVFTSDVGQRWATDWLNWPQYDQFFTQLVRWTMRPTGEEGKYQLATQVKDGKVQVIVTALDNEEKSLNFLDMAGSAIGPDLKPFSFALKQKAPGRYVGEFDINEAGAYMLNVIPASGQASLTSGVTVPFSDEYRIRQTNQRLLDEMVRLTPVGGRAGELLPPLEPGSLASLAAHDPFRADLPKAKSLEDVWPLAVLCGAVLFFADVFVRRVAIDLRLPWRWLRDRLGAKESAADQQRRASLDRLRTSKSTISDEIERQKVTNTFDADASQLPTGEAISEAFGTSPKPSSSAPTNSSSGPGLAPQEDDTSYTARLLEAKRRAKRDNQP